MKRFRFRPERILRLRRQILEIERAELGRALQELEAARQARERSHRAVNRLSEGLFRTVAATGGRGTWDGGGVASPDGSGADGASQVAGYLVLLADASRRLRHWDEQLAAAQQRVERQRSRVVEAHRAVRVLERLRERKWAEYRREQEREEGRHLDEAGSAAFLRRRASGAVADSSNGS